MNGKLLATIVVCAFVLGILIDRTGYLQQILGHQEDIIYLLKQHLYLTAWSGGFAILIGLTLGVLLSRPFMRFLSEPLMQVLNVGATVPTLATLALCMSFLGIGTVPAIFGLTFATLLPIVRNTYAGLKGVPSHFIEAAEGMGMRPLQLLFWVEIPNALYVMFTGIRTALAINVGTVPLAFLIGAGGLGELIFTGISLDDMPMLLAGAIPTALLAIAVDYATSVVSFFVIRKGVNPAASIKS